MILQGAAGYPVHEMVLHCAAISTGQFAHMTPFQAFATVNRWHIERGFSSFGYHALVMPDGQTYMGRPPEKIGAHVMGHNRGTLGVLLIESKRITHVGTFADWFTPQQRAKVIELARQWGVSHISTHNEYAPKLCAGFRAADEFPEWRRA